MQNKKTILIISIAIVLLLSGVIIYLISRVRNTEKEMLEMVEMASYEKEQLENEYTDMALEVEGQMLKIDNDSIFKLLEKEQKRVYMLDASAAIYMIPIDKYNKNYDMFLKGKLGAKGEEGQIEKLKKEKGVIVLITNDK